MSLPHREKKKSRMPISATPKLKLKMRRSFEENKTPKKSMRKRLFSSPVSNESGLMSPSSRIGRAFGSSKIFRTSTLQTKGVSGKSIASTNACSSLFEQKTLVNFSRPFPAENISGMTCSVLAKQRKKSSRTKYVEKMLKLKNGILSMKTQEANQSPSKNDRCVFKVWDIVSLKLSEKEKSVSISVNIQKRMTDETCNNRMDTNITYVLKFSTEEQSKYFAGVLVNECDAFATVIDINLGLSDAAKSDKVSKKHKECLMRKRYDLFNISRPQGDPAIKYSLDRLILFLRSNGGELEAKFWDEVDSGEGNFSVVNLDTRCGLKEIYESRNMKKSEFLSQVQETIENFGIDKDSTTKESYYINLYVNDELKID